MLRESPRSVVGTLCLTICATVLMYTIIVYMPSYLPQHFAVTSQQTFLAGVIGTFAMFLMEPVAGAMSDKYGRKKVLLLFLLPLTVLIYPFFHYLQVNPSLSRLLFIFTLVTILMGGFFGPFSTAMGEQFPTNVRSTRLAITYNIAVMVFGGFAGAIVTWLIHATGLVLAPILFGLFGCVCGIIGSIVIYDSKVRRATVF